MTKDELTKGAKAMVAYYSKVETDDGLKWDDLSDDAKDLWREMFRLGIKAVSHGS